MYPHNRECRALMERCSDTVWKTKELKTWGYGPELLRQFWKPSPVRAHGSPFCARPQTWNRVIQPPKSHTIRCVPLFAVARRSTGRRASKSKSTLSDGKGTGDSRVSGPVRVRVALPLIPAVVVVVPREIGLRGPKPSRRLQSKTNSALSSLCQADRAVQRHGVEGQAREALWGQEIIITSVLEAVSRASGSPFSVETHRAHKPFSFEAHAATQTVGELSSSAKSKTHKTHQGSFVV